jgi:hypothetical protein
MTCGRQSSVCVLVALMMIQWLFPAIAQPSDKQASALSELSFELTQCQMYYALMSTCADVAGQSGAANSFKRAVEQSARMSTTYGKMAGLSEQALMARLRNSARSFSEQTQGDSCLNASILIERYTQTCKAVMEHPESRLARLLFGR